MECFVSSAAICQIGPRLTKIGPKMDHLSMQNWTKMCSKIRTNTIELYIYQLFKKILGFEPYNTSMLKKAYFQCQDCLAWFADLSHLVCWVVLTARELLFVVYCVGFAEWCLNCHVCRVRLAEGSVGFDKSWGCLVRFRFAGLGLLDCVCLDRFTG